MVRFVVLSRSIPATYMVAEEPAGTVMNSLPEIMMPAGRLVCVGGSDPRNGAGFLINANIVPKPITISTPRRRLMRWEAGRRGMREVKEEPL